MPLHKKVKIALIAGHIVECFDNTIYGFFAIMLAPVFFSPDSTLSATLMAYGGFAAGFLARPLGAIFLGRLGDKYGRRNPLLWSMVLVGLPTAIIGLIPPFDVWGPISSLLLILCRLLQGFFYGAEYTGITLYNIEDTDKSSIGQRTGIIIGCGVFGAVIATAVGALVTMDNMPSWAWRIPFLCGGTAAFIVYLTRRELKETFEFELARQRNDITASPLKQVFSKYKLSLFIGILIGGLLSMPLYCCTIFANKLFREFGYSTSQSMLLNMAAMIFDGIFIMLAGRLADIIGFYRQMILGATLVALSALPAFILINVSVVTTLDIYLFIALLTIAGTIINGCAMPFLASCFPASCRYCGVALSSTLGSALLAGTTPLMNTLLITWFGTKLAPAFWLIFNSLLTASFIWYYKYKTQGNTSCPV